VTRSRDNETEIRVKGDGGRKSKRELKERERWKEAKQKRN